MGDMAERPKRAYQITIQIGADDWEAALAEMQTCIDHVMTHGERCNSVMGSSSSNHAVVIEIDKEMTHEKYFEELKKYINEIKKNETTRTK